MIQCRTGITKNKRQTVEEGLMIRNTAVLVLGDLTQLHSEAFLSAIDLDYQLLFHSLCHYNLVHYSFKYIPVKDE